MRSFLLFLLKLIVYIPAECGEYDEEDESKKIVHIQASYHTMATFGDLLKPNYNPVGKYVNTYANGQPQSNKVVGYTPQNGNVLKPTYQDVLGAKDPSQIGITGGGANAAPAGNQGLEQNINQQVNDLGSIIDRDYETAMGALASQEQGLRGQADVAGQAIQSQYGQAKTAVGEERATRESGITTQEQTATRQQASSLQQARDLYRQIQQQNIAQLSAAGLSSSSVAEGLAEKLGVETARRIAGVTGSTNEILQNLAGERTRVQTYYQQRLSDLEQTMTTQKAQIQQALIEGLNQLNSARNKAASDKSNRRQELITNAQSSLAQLQAQAQNFQQSLEQWQAQRAATLQQAQQFVLNPTDFSQLNNYAQQVSQLPQIGGFQAVPTFDPTSGGYVKPGVSYQKKPANQDEEALF